jgi:hypothetical protein
MKVEINQEPEIVLVTPANLASIDCPPTGCTPNVACNPNTNCNPYNCFPALGPCRPECAPSTPCYPTQGCYPH